MKDFKEQLQKMYKQFPVMQRERNLANKQHLLKAIEREISDRASCGHSFMEGVVYQSYLEYLIAFCGEHGLHIEHEPDTEDPVRSDPFFKYKISGWAE